MWLLWSILLYGALALLLATVVLQVVTLLSLPKSLRLEDKHMVVVGGSSGIGLAIAQLAAAEGALVTLVARDASRLSSAKEQVERYARGDASRVAAISADVTDPEEAARAMRDAAEAFGPVSALVCSQGVSRPGTFLEVPLATMREVMDTNYWGCVNAIRAAVPLMRAARGPRRIALISSQAGQVGLYGYSYYSASKFALRGLAECLQQELLPHGVLLTLVFPPDTDTPQLAEENKTKPEILRRIAASSKMMTPAAVARPALRALKAGAFLSSSNFEGFMLQVATAGMAPQPSALMAAVEVALAGVLRIAALVTLAEWRGIIRGWFREHPLPAEERPKDD